jgi:hypothetical protein
MAAIIRDFTKPGRTTISRKPGSEHGFFAMFHENRALTPVFAGFRDFSKPGRTTISQKPGSEHGFFAMFHENRALTPVLVLAPT